MEIILKLFAIYPSDVDRMFCFTIRMQRLTPIQEMNRTIDRDLLSLPLQSAALKRRLSRRYGRSSVAQPNVRFPIRSKYSQM
jgi:hypothetical protein